MNGKMKNDDDESLMETFSKGMFLIKLILKQYGIKFVRVKIDEENSDLVIGLKTRHLRDETEHRLPMTLLNGKSYYYYRRKYY